MKNLIVFILFSLITSVSFADAKNKEDKTIGNVLFVLNPAKIELQTDYTSASLVDLIEEYRTRALNGEMKDLGINTGYIEMDVKGEKAKLIFFSSELGALKKALKVKIEPVGDQKQLLVKARVPFCQMRELYKSDPSFRGEDGRWRFSKEVESQLERLLAL